MGGSEVKLSDLVQEFCHFSGERLQGRSEGFEKSLIGKVQVRVTDIYLRIGLP